MAVSIAATRELAMARGGRALLALGDMRELGALSAEEHDKVGQLAAQPGVALLIACGPEMARAAVAARAEAARATLSIDVAHTDDVRYASSLILERVAPKDVVLVKGSRGMRMERVLEPLVARPNPPHAAGGAA